MLELAQLQEKARGESDKKGKCILWKGSLQKSSIQHFERNFWPFFFWKSHLLIFSLSAPTATNDFVWRSSYFAINEFPLHGLYRKRDPSLEFKVYNLIRWNMANILNEKELKFLLVHFSHFWQRTINRQASRSHILSWKLPILLSQGISPVFIFHFYFRRTDSFIRSATKNGFSGDLELCAWP